eukprot:4971121-Amphidinium_carterae.1
MQNYALMRMNLEWRDDEEKKAEADPEGRNQSSLHHQSICIAKCNSCLPSAPNMEPTLLKNSQQKKV